MKVFRKLLEKMKSVYQWVKEKKVISVLKEIYFFIKILYKITQYYKYIIEF